MYKFIKLTKFTRQITQQNIPNQKPSLSSDDTTTTSFTSRSKYLHHNFEVTEVSQAYSTSSCLTTDLTLSVNCIVISTANVILKDNISLKQLLQINK